MQIGMIGLGRMGSNMVRRLMRAGHSCVVYDRSAAAVAGLVSESATGQLVARRVRRPPDAAAGRLDHGAGRGADRGSGQRLALRLAPGDAIIDGGNSHFKDDVRRARALRERGIDYLDVGTRGGVWGLERGYCLMIGGRQRPSSGSSPSSATLAPGRGAIEPVPGAKAARAPRRRATCIAARPAPGTSSR